MKMLAIILLLLTTFIDHSVGQESSSIGRDCAVLGWTKCQGQYGHKCGTGIQVCTYVDFFKVFLIYLPTHVRFSPIVLVLIYLVVSDFHKPTYLPQNRTSYVDNP